MQPTLQPSRLPRFSSAIPEHAGAYTGEKDVAQTKTATLNKNIPCSPFVPESVHTITSEDCLEAYPSPFSVEDSTETRAMTYEELREALAHATETIDLMQAYQVLIIPPFFL